MPVNMRVTVYVGGGVPIVRSMTITKVIDLRYVSVAKEKETDCGRGARAWHAACALRDRVRITDSAATAQLGLHHGGCDCRVAIDYIYMYVLSRASYLIGNR